MPRLKFPLPPDQMDAHVAAAEADMKRRGVDTEGLVLGGARVRLKGLVGAAHLNGREAGRCRLAVSKPVLKGPVVSALETRIS